MSTVFGLDFGTTNSSLAVNQNGKIEVIDIDEYNVTGKNMRSVIYFDEDKNIYVGQEAIERYIDYGASGRFMQSIKAYLPSKVFDYTYIHGKRYEVDDLIAIILRKIKQRGEDYVGHEVNSVVIGRPAIFSDDPEIDKLAEDRLKSSVRKAGFKDIYFQFEPIAVALTFEATLKEGEENKVIVGDFGGGTSDFTVINLRGGALKEKRNRIDNILSLKGVYIGGDIFDSRIMWDKVARYFGKDVKHKSMTGQWLDMPTTITSKLRHWHLIPQLREKRIREHIKQIKATASNKALITNLENLIEDNYGFVLLQSIEKAKCEISSYQISQIVFRERNLSIKEEITRTDFEHLIGDDIDKIKKCINSALCDAGLTESDIDMVFLTGGSSYVPCIRKIFIEKFGADKIREVNAFTSVVYGLGISAALYQVHIFIATTNRIFIWCVVKKKL